MQMYLNFSTLAAFVTALSFLGVVHSANSNRENGSYLRSEGVDRVLQEDCSSYYAGYVSHYDLHGYTLDEKGTVISQYTLYEKWAPTTPICKRCTISIHAVVRCKNNFDTYIFDENKKPAVFTSVTGPAGTVQPYQADNYTPPGVGKYTLTSSIWVQDIFYVYHEVPGTSATVSFEVQDMAMCSKADYLKMSDQDLFNYALSPSGALFATGGTCNNKLTKGCCGIQDATSCYNSWKCACRYYVKSGSANNGVDGYNGWPKGTGCVYSPGKSGCYYTDKATFCTQSEVTNAANQLRDAFRNNKCGLYC